MSILLGGASIFGLKDGEVINEWPQPDTVQRLAAPNSQSLAIERGGEIWLRTAKNLEKYCDDGAFCVTNQNDTNGQFFTVSDKEISVWDILFDIATKLKTIDVKTSRPTAVATNTQSGGSHIFVGNGNGTCSATSMTNHSSTIISEIKLQTSKSPILGMKCIAGQTKKIGLFQESEAFLYDFIGGKTVHTWKHHVAPLRAMEFSPVSPDLGFTASYDYHCKMFDLRTSEIVLSKRFDRPIKSAIFTADGTGIYLADMSGFIHKLDLKTNTCEKIYGNLESTTNTMCLVPERFEFHMLEMEGADQNDDPNSSFISTYSGLGSPDPQYTPEPVRRARNAGTSCSPLTLHTSNGRDRVVEPELRILPVPQPVSSLATVSNSGDFPQRAFSAISSESLGILEGAVQELQIKVEDLQTDVKEIKADVKDIKAKVDDLTETWLNPLPIEHLLTQTARAESRVIIVQPLLSRMWDHWFEQTQLAWAGRDEMNGHVVNLNVKLDCIMEQLRRMSLPTNNNLY